eukprot:2516312-Rhodomonas_salina.1
MLFQARLSHGAGLCDLRRDHGGGYSRLIQNILVIYILCLLSCRRPPSSSKCAAAPYAESVPCNTQRAVATTRVAAPQYRARGEGVRGAPYPTSVPGVIGVVLGRDLQHLFPAAHGVQSAWATGHGVHKGVSNSRPSGLGSVRVGFWGSVFQ